MRARVLCGAGAIALMTVIPAARPAYAQGLNDIVRNLNNAINPNDAQRSEDQARRQDGRSEDGQYRRPTSEFRGYNRNGTDQGDYGDRRNNGQRR
jgi:UPF0716 family protein affecting phage T7 exclusion